MNGAVPLVFHYTDYRAYLRDWYLDARKRRPGFSLRAFAKRAGFHSHNFLKLVVQGQRNLSHESVRKFANGLGLTRGEADYFQALVAYNQTEKIEERRRAYERLLQAQEMSQLKTLPHDQYSYFNTWYHAAIRELVSSPGFRKDPRWIASQLTPPITAAEASASLKLLQRIGFLERDRSGKLRQANQLLTTGPEVHSDTLGRYHRVMLDLAKSAIERFPRNRRDISSLTLGVSGRMIPILKRRIQLFREEVMRLVSTERSAETVVQLNLQLFPLTSLEEVSHD